MIDVEALVALAIKDTPGGRCWFSEQEDADTKVYLSMLDEIEANSPGSVNRQQVMRTLKKDLGVHVSRYIIQTHFKGDCSCER